ncbi:MAG TPA: hypothetical protein DCE28_04665, partial [Halomonas sp.]|nr:hypothetical protein [Halomonas sp.]
RDERQPHVSLGNVLQMNLIELNKADRLGLPEGPLRAWITFFKHWQEELTMANVAHEPVKRAMSRIRELSADEETRRLAFVRERALRDEVSFLNDAKREGLQEGEQLGIEKGRQEAEQRALESKRNAARKLIALTEMNDQLIAEIEELPVEEVERLRAETHH